MTKLEEDLAAAKANKMVHNTLINLNEGYAWFGAGKVGFAEDGSGHLANRQIAWNKKGEGYVAGGSIAWNEQGEGHVANGNISWDALGNLLMRGWFESNKEGNKIVIDPNERSIKLMSGDKVYSEWYFDAENDFSAMFFKRDDDEVVITPNYLRSATQDRAASLWGDKNFGIRYTVKPFILNDPDTAHFEVRAETIDTLILIARKLPTSSEGLLHGQVWNDNGTLKVVK